MTRTDLMRAGYARYSSRDFAFADELFADDIDWQVPGENGDRHGRDDVKAFFGELTQLFSAHTITLLDSVESGDTLVCRVRHDFTRAADGGTGAVDAVHWWTFRGDRAERLSEVADTMAFALAAGLLPAGQPA